MVKTVAIIDFAHCGTTMLAGICEILGVPMIGDNYDRKNWEDLDIIEGLKGRDGFAEVVRQRDEQYDMWGFKAPGALSYYPRFSQHLRNPVFLAIYKDLASVTYRRFGVSQNRLYVKMRNTARQMERSVDRICRSGLDVHMLSYCKAIIAPREFVLRIADIIGLGLSDEQIDTIISYIQPNSAHPRKRYQTVEGFLA